jgi:hypothetical protein
MTAWVAGPARRGRSTSEGKPSQLPTSVGKTPGIDPSLAKVRTVTRRELGHCPAGRSMKWRRIRQCFPVSPRANGHAWGTNQDRCWL